MTFITIWSFLITQVGFAYAQRLGPETFEKMYELADKGNLYALKSAVSRGLNINSINSDGNTGVCEAILRGDYRAYNTFYAAGANPTPACVYRINKAKYQGFMASRFSTPLKGSITYTQTSVKSESLFKYLLGAATVGGVYLMFSGGGDEDEDVNFCENVECGENEECREDSTVANGYTCECSDGFFNSTYGDLECVARGACNIDTDCSTDYRFNGTDSMFCNGNSCDCKVDYEYSSSSGKCEKNYDYCLDNSYCETYIGDGVSGSAVCSSNTCVCSEGYDLVSGKCEKNICSNIECGEGGTCSVDKTEAKGYKCNCNTGYQLGSNSGQCIKKPACESDANCTYMKGVCHVDEYECVCADGYFKNSSGICEESPPECGEKCGAYGTCYINDASEFRCSCQYSTSSNNPSDIAYDDGPCPAEPEEPAEPADPCDGVNCQNGATCNKGVCICPEYYSGTYCQYGCPSGKCGDNPEYLCIFINSAGNKETSQNNVVGTMCQCEEGGALQENSCSSDKFCDVADCGDHGSCQKDIDECVCDSNWFGTYCKISCTEPSSYDCNSGDNSNSGSCELLCGDTSCPANFKSSEVTGKFCKCDDTTEVKITTGAEKCANVVTPTPAAAPMMLMNNLNYTAFDGTQERVVVVEADSGKSTYTNDIIAYVEDNIENREDSELIGVKANVDEKVTDDTNVFLNNISMQNDTDNDVTLTAVEAYISNENYNLNINLDEYATIDIYSNFSATAINAAGANAFVNTYGDIYMSGKNDLYGIKVSDGAESYNYGTIDITANNSYGMHATNNATIVNEGKINITGDNSYAMYADNATMKNLGEITISGDDSYGMYAVNNSVVFNSGTININASSYEGNISNGNYIHIDDSSYFVNADGGVLNVEGDFSINNIMLLSANSLVNVAGIAKFSATVINEEIGVGQKDSYTTNSIVNAADVNNVALTSDYAFWNMNANTTNNGDGTYSVGATYDRIAFESALENQNYAKFLEHNYSTQHSIYSDIIKASSSEANVLISNALGEAVLSNFAQQNMDLFNSINFNIDKAINNQLDFNKEENVISGYNYYNSNAGSTSVSTGYSDKATTLFALFEKKYSPNSRFGIGGAITLYDSSYYNSSNRDEMIYQIYGLYSTKFGDYTFSSMPTIGLGMGQMDRVVNGNTYNSDITNYYYGISNTLKSSFSFKNNFSVEPLLLFNVSGIYQDAIKENGMLETEGANNMTAEVGTGLYIKKDFIFDERSSLKLKAGGSVYYNIISNPYADINTSVSGLVGGYKINSTVNNKDRQAFSASAVYTYDNVDVNFDISKYINTSDEDGYSFNVNVKYNFE